MAVQAATTPVAASTAQAHINGYAGNLPWCNRCSYHHHIPSPCCERNCIRCGKKGHLTRSCRTPTQLINQASESSTDQACYGCGEIGHFKRNCPKAATTNNTNNAEMVLAMKQEEIAVDPIIVAGTFLLDNSYARILFESSAKEILLVIHSNIFVNLVLV
ncbi:cellular nucleic acid-binding protein homolog [Lactuca sativa]|uniref:cellular nucleic acid-binding protein homolog n=1 Tax=Lactuca sativa TaxID=4236 RepID=UPI000CD95961|nr:cellular nucleic acid-binding protein homolog [Lactuca sativa]